MSKGYVYLIYNVKLWVKLSTLHDIVSTQNISRVFNVANR